MEPLTELQAEILKFIKSYREEMNSSPSYREIQKHFGYKSVKAVQDHIQALWRKGALEKPAGGKAKRRARHLLPVGDRVPGIRKIPIYGEIAAGAPRDSAQLQFGSLVISDTMTKATCFGLKVTGNSMVDAGIYEGDFLVIEKSSRVKNGDIIVALLDGETTVKRYKEQNGKIFLVPENKELKPISTQGRQLDIQGKVIGLQRKY